MKKLLILAYDFPPYVSVGGLRPYSWYKYLKEFDIYPIVITRQWDNKYGNYLDYITPSKSKETIIEETEYGTIIRTPYIPNLANRIMLKYGENRFKLLRKTVTAYYEFMQWFFPVGTKVNLYKEAKKYLKNNTVDAIIATGEPFVLFRYASLLSKKYKKPWIADYRDTWSQDKKRSNNVFLEIVNKNKEKQIVGTSKLITTVSKLLGDTITNAVNKEYKIIINGYDHSISKKAFNTKQNSEELSIAFAGTIYNWHPIESFLEVCYKLTSGINFRINFYGINIEDKIKELIRIKYTNLEEKLNFTPRLKNEQLIEDLAKNNVLLLFNDYSVSGTKIYDYLAVKRKILFCYTNDSKTLKLKEKYYNFDDSNSPNNHLQEDIIKETNSGILVTDNNNLEQALQNLYLEHKTKGYIKCNSTGIEKYSRKLQVEKLADIIKRLTLSPIQQ